MNLKSTGSLKKLFQNYYHFIILFLFTLANAYIAYRIDFAVDDFWFKEFAVCSPKIIFEYFQWHYLKENGRLLVHILAVMFLRNNVTFILWKVLLVFSLTFFCLLVAKIISTDKSQFKRSVAITVFVFMTVLTNIYDGSVYWLTGSFNYFFPVLLLLAIMFLSIKKPTSFWLPILGLLCGATTEQPGLMVIGWFVLLIFDRLVQEKKFSFHFLICAVFSAIGYATVIFSPATDTRVSNQGRQTLQEIIINVLKVIRRNWIDNIGLVFFETFLVISVCFWLIKFSKKGSLRRKASILLTVYLIAFDLFNYGMKFLLYICGTFFQKISFSTTANRVIGTLWFIYLIILSICSIYVVIKIYIRQKNILILSSTILGVGSQIMMSASNYAPIRTCFSGVAMLLIFIVYSFNMMYADSKKDNCILYKKLTPSVLKITTCVCCIFACLFQIAFSYVFRFSNLNDGTEKQAYYPLTSEELIVETTGRENRNHIFFSDPNSSWNEKYDVWDFSLYD